MTFLSVRRLSRWHLIDRGRLEKRRTGEDIFHYATFYDSNESVNIK